MKVKESVKLEELVKYGFYKNDWSDGGYSYLVPDNNGSGRPVVHINVNKYGFMAFELEDGKSLFGLTVPDVLIDLANDGLVEKEKTYYES